MMRTVQYLRHEVHQEPEPREAPLHAFFFDVPYMSACGIFPPLHLLNQRLLSGGGAGGMSPGASWEPFEISEVEYLEVLPAIFNPNRVELEQITRYAWETFALDTSFDHLTDYNLWMRAVCDKRRVTYASRLSNAEFNLPTQNNTKHADFWHFIYLQRK